MGRIIQVPFVPYPCKIRLITVYFQIIHHLIKISFFGLNNISNPYTTSDQYKSDNTFEELKQRNYCKYSKRRKCCISAQNICAWYRNKPCKAAVKEECNSSLAA